MVDTALGLEGLKRQWGVHAAGVIMSSDPLIDIIPIMRREQDGAIITQFDYPTCESLGLIKMDFLGLRNLTVLDDALENITAATAASTWCWRTWRWTTRPTYALLGRGDTLGVFQLDGGPMRQLLRSMRPDSFADISAVLALYRPGPMGADSHNKYARRKTGREPVTSIHPELAEPLADILDETYGLIVYQEQVLQIAQRVAGYSLGKADLLRKAMGKKKKEVLDAEFVPFSEGHGGQRLLQRRRSPRCGTSWSRSPTTPSTGRTPRRTGWCRTGPPTSRPTTRPSSWPRCSPRWPTTRTRSRSTWASAVGWASRCCRRT